MFVLGIGGCGGWFEVMECLLNKVGVECVNGMCGVDGSDPKTS